MLISAAQRAMQIGAYASDRTVCEVAQIDRSESRGGMVKIRATASAVSISSGGTFAAVVG